MTDHNQNDGSGNDLDCETALAQLSEYLDGQLSPSDATAYAQHLASCTACATLERELRDVVAGARSLPMPPLPRELWPEIAARLETPVLALPLTSSSATASASGERSSERSGERSGARSWQFMAAAAALLVTLSAGVTWSIARRGIADTTPPALAAANPDRGGVTGDHADREAVRAIDGQTTPQLASTGGAETDAPNAVPTRDANASPRAIGTRAGGTRNGQGPAVTVAAAGTTTEQPRAQLASNTRAHALDTLYGREIALLRTVAESQLGLLDSSTVHIVRRNLDIIDEAIRECRTALADDPNSGFLLDQLGHAYERKVDLLRRLALL